MARTRNRQMKQAEAFVQASPKKIWKAGIYTRISVDINGEKRESLETQKLIALSYAESHPDIEVVKFYKDAPVIIGLKTLRREKCWKRGAF